MARIIAINSCGKPAYCNAAAATKKAARGRLLTCCVLDGADCGYCSAGVDAAGAGKAVAGAFAGAAAGAFCAFWSFTAK